MSDTDPYAAPENAPAVEEAKTVDSFDQPVEVPVAAAEPVQAPATEEAVPEGSIKEVLRWVGDDAEKAKKALEAEHNGEQRTTLISKLESIIN